MSRLSSALGRLPRAWRGQAGFTLIEMLTVFLVVGVLSALILVNTQTGDRRQELRDSAAKFVNLTRNVEARAAASEPVNGTSRKAYGICITSTTAADGYGAFPKSRCAPAGGAPNAYQTYARTLADTTANPALNQRPVNPDILQSESLPKNYRFSVGGYMDYVPPKPQLSTLGFFGVNPTLRIIYTGSSGCTSAADCKTIRIRPSAGVIYVE